MFLAFPLDYQKDMFIRAAGSLFGRLLEWYRDENRSRILVQALILSVDRVSGEASPKNDLGRSSTSKFSHGQSDAPKIAARLQAPAAAVHGIR